MLILNEWLLEKTKQNTNKQKSQSDRGRRTCNHRRCGCKGQSFGPPGNMFMYIVGIIFLSPFFVSSVFCHCIFPL